MKQPEAGAFLWDVRNGCALLEEIARTKTFDQFTNDTILRMAVERQFEIIAEALRNVLKIDPQLGTRITSAAEIIAFRNRIVHDYWRIIGEMVWAIIHDDVPVLHREVSELLNELPPPNPPPGPPPA